MPQVSLSRIELDAPHRRLVVELQEKVSPPEAPKPEETVEEGGADIEEPVAETVEEEWVLVEPELDGQPKEGSIDRFTKAFANVTASDIVGRDEFERYGLKEPIAICSLTTRTGNTSELWFGNLVPGSNGAHYARWKDGRLVYKMDRWALESVCPKMSTFTDIEAPDFSKESVTSLIAEHGDRRFEFGKRGETWVLRLPSKDAEIGEDAINAMLTVITDLKPQDIATISSPEITTLDTPEAIIHFSLKDGETHSLTFGGHVPLTAGDRFVRFDSRDEAWTVAKGSWDSIERLIEEGKQLFGQ
jgi:hypothetical protein